LDGRRDARICIGDRAGGTRHAERARPRAGVQPRHPQSQVRAAGKRVSIYVTNEDPTPEEFESTALKVEKVIPGKSKGLVRIGPLAPGRYEFIGDFHADTAKGVVIAE
jgi:hypothetical protein